MVAFRKHLPLAAATLALFACRPAPLPAQGFLQRLEQRVQEVINDADVRVDSRRAAPTPAGGYLGLTAEEDPDTQTLLVVAVKPGSPAAKAGLRVEDQILTVDGRDVESVAHMGELLAARQAGARVTFTVVRKGQPQELTATLTAVPRDRPTPTEANANDPPLTLADTDRPAARQPAAEAGRAAGPNSSVLRRLERKVEADVGDWTGPDRAVTPTREPGARNPESLTEQIRRLQASIDRLERRVAQLEAQLGEPEARPELPEPKP